MKVKSNKECEPKFLNKHGLSYSICKKEINKNLSGFVDDNIPIGEHFSREEDVLNIYNFLIKNYSEGNDVYDKENKYEIVKENGKSHIIISNKVI